MKSFSKGFTLVELMIVVVILSIVATIGFISYEDYLVDTRDSKRLAQLTSLRDSMRLSITKGSLPIPDNSIEIRNNGQPFMYQGYAGKNVLDSIAFSENTYDPKDEQFYTYLVSTNKKDFQLLGFLEKYNPDVVSLNTSQVFAEDYSQRFPRTVGKKLGVLLQQQSNTPIQELSPYTASGFFDLATDTTNTIFDAYITDTYLISGSGGSLTGIIPFTTCKKILENGDSYGDGYYSINPSGTDPFEVYCNMTIDGGGWTLVARSVLNDPQSFGWKIKSGNIRNDEILYSMGESYKILNFNEVMLTTYTIGKNISKAIKAYVPKDVFRPENEGTPLPYSPASVAPLFSTSNCTILLGTPQTRCFFNRIGYTAYSKSFVLNNNNVTDDRWRFSGLGGNSSLQGTFYGATTSGVTEFGDFHGQPGMIFVR